MALYFEGVVGLAKIISLFNHKGGVSKTTTTYHLGWMLASKGYKVLMIDTDSQCNLTGLVLGEDAFETFYEEHPQNNIKSALDPAFLGQPIPINEIDGVFVKENLWLIPGHIDITELDISLGMAHNFSSSMAILMNLPGALYAFIDKMVAKFNIEYVIIDMNPSLSETNKNLLMISDYFIIPTAPDFFSQMALSTLSNTLPKWKKWSITAKDFFKDSTYPFPEKSPKLLGIIMQNFLIRKGKPASAFQNKIDRVLDKLMLNLNPALEKNHMLLSGKARELQLAGKCTLAYIPNFQSLVARMQESGAPSTPVYAIDERYLGTGITLTNYITKMDEFEKVFSNMTDLILELMKYD